MPIDWTFIDKMENNVIALIERQVNHASLLNINIASSLVVEDFRRCQRDKKVLKYALKACGFRQMLPPFVPSTSKHRYPLSVSCCVFAKRSNPPNAFYELKKSGFANKSFVFLF